MILGFTGTRRGLTSAQAHCLDMLLQSLHPTRVHHGGCVGADHEFHDLTRGTASIPRTVHLGKVAASLQANLDLEAGDTVLTELPPLERNRAIVDAAEMLVACPASQQEEQRSGTWATIRYCRKVGKPLVIVWPNGTQTQERARGETAS